MTCKYKYDEMSHLFILNDIVSMQNQNNIAVILTIYSHKTKKNVF